MGTEAVLDVAPGAALRVPLPDGATQDAALPAIEVGGIPGARVVANAGWNAGEAHVRAACVAGPADRWAPGVEDLVLERAGAIARGALPAPATRWDAHPMERVGQHVEQRVDGVLEGGAALRVRHWLGFAGPGPEVVVCSVVCSTPAAEPCDALVAGARVDGFVAPPPPSLAVRATLAAAEHPALAAAILGAAAATTIAVVLRRRPRPRR